MTTQTKQIATFHRLSSGMRIARFFFLNFAVAHIATIVAFFIQMLRKSNEFEYLLFFGGFFLCAPLFTLIIQSVIDNRNVVKLEFTRDLLRILYRKHYMEFPLDSVVFKSSEKTAFFNLNDPDDFQILDLEGKLLLEVDRTWSDRLAILRHLEIWALYTPRVSVLERDEQLSNAKNTINTGLGTFLGILLMVLALIGVSSYGIWVLAPALLFFIYMYRNTLSHLTTKAK